jgi:hypothetical protein
MSGRPHIKITESVESWRQILKRLLLKRNCVPIALKL